MFTNSAKYAMKAVLYLAVHSSENDKMPIKDIHERINVPRAYLAKLLQELSRHGIVSSSRGPKGGFYLSEKNKDLPLIKVVDVIDGKKRVNSCILAFKDCNEDEPCPLHGLIDHSKSELLKKLRETSIGPFAVDLRGKGTFLSY